MHGPSQFRASPAGRVAAGALLISLCAVAPVRGEDEGDAHYVRWEGPHTIASGDAYRGPWRMNESEFHFVDDPTVAVDQSGGVAVVWANHKVQDLFFQRFDGDGTARFEEPVNISRSPDVFSWLPRIVVAAAVVNSTFGRNRGSHIWLWRLAEN